LHNEIMTFLINLLGVNIISIMLVGEGKVSFGLYEIKRSLTPLGWAVFIVLPIALIFALVYLTVKILKNQNQND